MVKKWLIILFILIILVLVGIGVYFYFNKEVKIKDNQVIYANLNIIAMNNNEQVVVNYIISQSSISTLYANGTTLKDGFVFAKIPLNSTYFIRSNNNSFYTAVNKVDVFSQEPKRIVLNLVSPGKITFKQSNPLDNNKNFNLSISSEGEFRNPTVCLIWSRNIINVLVDKSEIEKEEKYSKYDKCFSINNKDSLNINADVFGSLDRLDYLNFIVYDKDIYEGITNTNWQNEYYYNTTINY